MFWLYCWFYDAIWNHILSFNIIVHQDYVLLILFCNFSIKGIKRDVVFEVSLIYQCKMCLSNILRRVIDIKRVNFCVFFLVESFAFIIWSLVDVRHVWNSNSFVEAKEYVSVLSETFFSKFLLLSRVVFDLEIHVVQLSQNLLLLLLLNPCELLPSANCEHWFSIFL